MKSRAHGQGAMEYLMTYGWAILVVMAVGVAMWQLGIFNLGGITSTTSTGFPRVKPLLPMTSMNTSGYFYAYFVNGAAAPIAVNQPIDATVRAGACTISPPAEEINNGEQFMISGNCTVTGARGDPYEIDLTISYNVSHLMSATTHRDKGKIMGPLE
ncbi:MAG: hypothetical protein ABH834_03380 [Candidatus Altiarchaeota archaeon]